jgi:hypothetical protein
LIEMAMKRAIFVHIYLYANNDFIDIFRVWKLLYKFHLVKLNEKLNLCRWRQ